MNERALDDLRRLAERDRELAARAAALRAREDEVAWIRARAELVEAFAAAWPAERARRAAELDAARTDLAARRAELAGAEEARSDARDDEARAEAERRQARAADHVAVALARVDRAEAAVRSLEREAADLPAELPALAERARAIAEVEPPGESLVEWASHAHAQLFVAAGQVDAQRERVIREANELASMLLGEPTYGSTVEQVLARVAHWASAPGHVSESR